MQKKPVFFSISLLALICLISSLTIESQPPPVIRLHILANSDSEQDQALKYKVRDHVIALMGEKFKESRSIDESREILLASLNQLEEAARLTLEEAGSHDEVKAVYGNFDFPTRSYGAFSLPAGKYEALQLVIGSGRGANWWCMLFPPLCFVDAQKTKVVDTSISQDKVIKIKPAFKIVKIWKSTLDKMAAGCSG